MVNPRAICRALDRSFSLSCSSFSLSSYPPSSIPSLSERRGRSLNRARTQTRAQIFRCRFNPTCMTNREFFRAPPVRFFPIFPLFLPQPQPCSLASLSIGVRKKLLRVDRFAKATATTVTFIPTGRYYHIHYRGIDIIPLLRYIVTLRHRFFARCLEKSVTKDTSCRRTMVLIFFSTSLLMLC